MAISSLSAFSPAQAQLVQKMLPSALVTRGMGDGDGDADDGGSAPSISSASDNDGGGSRLNILA